MNEFYIENQYGEVDFSFLDEVLNYTLEKLALKNSTFSVIFVDNAEIKRLNDAYRGIAKETDVISFALNDNGKIPGPINVLGDIYISIPKMQSQAKEYGHSEKRELSFLALHGLLHLLGYDHQDEAEEKMMFNLQKTILNELGIIS